MTSKDLKVCLTAFVFGSYKRFVPLFCYSAVKSYPEYSVKIFVDGKLSDAEKACIKDIQENVSPHAHIQEYAFQGIEMPQTPRVHGGQKIFLRWLFEQSDFAGFDCVYFSDIDFLVLRQEPTLAEFHIKNANRFGLPFSNMVRADKTNSGQCPDRLSGLHFVVSDPYFARVDPVVRRFKSDPGLITEAIPKAFCDEHFLYHLVSRAIPFDGHLLRRSPRPIPGAHLGWARERHDLSTQTRRMMSWGSDSRPSFPEIHAQLSAFCKDSVFLRTIWRVKVPEVAVFLAQMGVVPTGFWSKHRITFLVAEARADLWYRRAKARLGFQAGP